MESDDNFSSEPDCNNTADVPFFLFVVQHVQQFRSSRVGGVLKFGDSTIILQRILPKC